MGTQEESEASGIGKEFAWSVEGERPRRRISFAGIMEHPEEVGTFVGGRGTQSATGRARRPNFTWHYPKTTKG